MLSLTESLRGEQEATAEIQPTVSRAERTDESIFFFFFFCNCQGEKFSKWRRLGTVCTAE